jgi:hypothetical protein
MHTSTMRSITTDWTYTYRHNLKSEVELGCFIKQDYIILPVVLYGCETWSLTLKEEHKLRVFENRGHFKGTECASCEVRTGL